MSAPTTSANRVECVSVAGGNSPPVAQLPARESPARKSPLVEFCGHYRLVDSASFTIGRNASLVLDDDNRFLHRQFLLLTEQDEIWLLSNVGRRLCATASDPDGTFELILRSGASLPLTTTATVVRFLAGPTHYELVIHLPEGPFKPVPAPPRPRGDRTVGRPTFTPDQRLLLLVLAEPALRGGRTASVALPTSSKAAHRLGWSLSKFNRKLDNVCEKLAKLGVGGLHGDVANLAFQRRARLVEYAISSRLVTVADLAILNAVDR